jgi:hypothetical protein
MQDPEGYDFVGGKLPNETAYAVFAVALIHGRNNVPTKETLRLLTRIVGGFGKSRIHVKETDWIDHQWPMIWVHIDDILEERSREYVDAVNLRLIKNYLDDKFENGIEIHFTPSVGSIMLPIKAALASMFAKTMDFANKAEQAKAWDDLLVLHQNQTFRIKVTSTRSNDVVIPSVLPKPNLGCIKGGSKFGSKEGEWQTNDTH